MLGAGSLLSALPAPLRFAVIAGAGFAAVIVLRQAGWWLVAAVAVLWIGVALSLARYAGWWPRVTAPIAPMLDWLLGGAALTGAGSVKPTKLPDRASEAREAEKIIGTLCGLAEPKTQLRQLVEYGQRAKPQGPIGLGNRPATVILLHGEHGTGKTTVAKALARLLYGKGITARPNIEALRPTSELKADPLLAAEASARRSAGGILLIDDADWLEAASPTAGGPMPFGLDVGRGILTAAKAAPGAITIVVAGGAALQTGLIENAGHRAAWLDQLRVFEIAFDHLTEAELRQIFDATLRQARAALGTGAEDSLAAVIGREAGRDGFGNAHRMSDLADQAIRKALRRAVTPSPTNDTVWIEARDIRASSNG